jgi:hypothetical protein
MPFGVGVRFHVPIFKGRGLIYISNKVYCDLVLRIRHRDVRFEVFTAVTMKNAVFWDVAPCTSCVNRRFGRMYRLHLQPPAHAGFSLGDFSTLKMEALRFSETSVYSRSTRRHIPEDGILQDTEAIHFKQALFKNMVVLVLTRCNSVDGCHLIERTHCLNL